MALTPPWETKRELVEKAVDETDPAYGCEPSKRSLEQRIEYGFLNVDKHAGPTSHDVTAMARRIMGAKRAGHSGTLEEPCSGAIPA
ncbi:MAG: hypothetical protein QW057_03025 [Candidatus Bathyarchaeia archaeon]